MATSQPASLSSNIYEQFDVRHKEGLTDPIYICLLAPCSENEVSFETYASWETHRSTEHMEPNDDKNKLPAEWEIRDWVAKNKPRPSDVSVKPKPVKERKRFPINPGVFAELDIRVTDEGRERYFCLLDPCRGRGKSYQYHRCWTNHRQQVHKQLSFEDGEFTLPNARLIKAWVKKGKPVPFQIPPQFLPNNVEVNSGARPPTGSRHVLEDRRLDPPETTVRNVFDEIDFSRDVDGKMSFFCRLPNCVNSGVSYKRREMLETHRIKSHKDIPQLELLPSRHVLNQWLCFGKPRPYTIRRGGRPRRPRNVAEGSTEREPAHQKKLPSSGCSVAAIEEDPNPSASVEDSNGSIGRDSNVDLMNSFDDESASTEYFDPDHMDRDQDVVDDQNSNQISDDAGHQYSAEMAEAGDEAFEAYIALGNLVPSLAIRQSEGSKAQSSECSGEIQTEPVQKSVTPVDLNMARVSNNERKPAGMVEVGEGSPGEFVALENLWPQISLIQSGTKEFIDIHAGVPIHELEPPEMADIVGDEALKELLLEETSIQRGDTGVSFDSEDDNDYQPGDLWKPVSLDEIFRAYDYDLSDLPRADDTPEYLIDLYGEALLNNLNWDLCTTSLR